MAQMIHYEKELIRINPTNSQRLDYSTNAGRTWIMRCNATNVGNFQDLNPNGKEILATTTKGLYYSKNEGRTWMKRN